MRIRLLAALLLAVIGLSLSADGRFAEAKFGQTELPESITIDLNPMNDSEISGSATLRAENGSTTISISLFAPDGAYPAHVHAGTCDDYDAAPEFPLADGDPSTETTTVVDVPLQQLFDDGYVIDVHTPSDDLNELLNPESVVVCGEISTEAANIDTDTSNTGTGDTPSTGVGSTFAEASNRTSLLQMLGLSVFFVFLGFGVRRTLVPANRRASLPPQR